MAVKVVNNAYTLSGGDEPPLYSYDEKRGTLAGGYNASEHEIGKYVTEMLGDKTGRKPIVRGNVYYTWNPKYERYLPTTDVQNEAINVDSYEKELLDTGRLKPYGNTEWTDYILPGLLTAGGIAGGALIRNALRRDDPTPDGRTFADVMGGMMGGGVTAMGTKFLLDVANREGWAAEDQKAFNENWQKSVDKNINKAR